MTRIAVAAILFAALAGPAAAASPRVPIDGIALGCDSRQYGTGSYYSMTVVNGTPHTIPAGTAIVITTYSRDANGKRKVERTTFVTRGAIAPNTSFVPFVYTNGRSRCDATWARRIEPRKGPRHGA